MCQENLGVLRGKLSCEKQHWPFNDSAKATDSEEEIMNEFRRVRDQIMSRIREFVRNR